MVTDLYTVGKELGSGGFSVVRIGKDKQDNTEWALKMIQMSVFKQHQEQTEKEVSVMASLNHPGVVHLREVIVTPKFYVIVMEVLRGGELFDRIVQREKYDENDAIVVARSVLETIDFLHAHGVVHRDLKPENLIFDKPGEDARIKLTDFGFATFFSQNAKLTASCGTPEYVAPEVLDSKPYDNAVDMWSCGVIIYILLCGFPPFYGENDDDLFDKVCACRYEFLSPYWDPVSEDAKDLIRKLLVIDPKKRLTASQALKHKWFVGHKETNRKTDLKSALEEMRRYNATRKFKKGVLGVIAANKLKGLLGDSLVAEE